MSEKTHPKIGQSFKEGGQDTDSTVCGYDVQEVCDWVDGLKQCILWKRLCFSQADRKASIAGFDLENVLILNNERAIEHYYVRQKPAIHKNIHLKVPYCANLKVTCSSGQRKLFCCLSS